MVARMVPVLELVLLAGSVEVEMRVQIWIWYCSLSVLIWILGPFCFVVLVVWSLHLKSSPVHSVYTPPCTMYMHGSAKKYV